MDSYSFHCQLDRSLDASVAALPDWLRESASPLIAHHGKRIRPRLVYYFSLLGKVNHDAIVTAATIVELLHMASLLHDDVIDQAETRRGAPSGQAVVGNEAAILAGIALFGQALTRSLAVGDRAYWIVASSAETLARGEIVDCDRAFDHTITFAEYLEVVRLKTGELFRLPIELIGNLAAFERNEMSAAITFGTLLGAAFQIIDDCLDLGPHPGAGKPLGTDHLRGLYGAPTLLALSSKGRAARTVFEILEYGVVSSADLAALRSAVAKAGGYRAAARAAFDLLEQASNLAAEFDDDTCRSGLRAMIDEVDLVQAASVE